MVSFRRSGVLPLTLAGLSSFFASTASAASTINAVSIYNLPLGSNSNYSFALNIPDESTDLYFHLSGPASYSWLAVGTGREMKDSLMIVVYSNADGKNVTVSPRLSSGEQEPVYSSSIAITLLDGTGVINNTMTVNGRCSNCTTWTIGSRTGSLDLKSSSQPWIYGLGPTGGSARMLRSDSKTASIERHSKYGVFDIDMIHATGGSGGLPASYTIAQGTSSDGGETNDSNWPSIIHALCLGCALILLFPFGAILLRVFPKSVRWHWVNQTVSSCIAAIGLVIGFYLSTQFTKSQSYGSTHQILGIIILLAIIAQWGMGFWHHRLYKQTQTPSLFGVVHRYFGFVLILLAIVNGGIGLSWSYASNGVLIGYSIGVIITSVVIIGLLGRARFKVSRGGKGFVRQPQELDEFQNSDQSDGYLDRGAGGSHGYGYNRYG